MTYSSTAPPRTNKSRKKGNIERTSITFMASFRNTTFSGDPANLRRYSVENQATLVVSIRDRMGFSTMFPFMSYKIQCKLQAYFITQTEPQVLRLVSKLTAPTVYWRASRVLAIIPTMETATKLMEVTEITWARVLLSECSIVSHRYFW